MAEQLPRSATLAIRGIQVGHEAKLLDKSKDYRTAYLYYCSATNILLSSLEDPNWSDKDLMQTVISSSKEFMERAKFISDNYLDPSDTGMKIDYKQLVQRSTPKPPPPPPRAQNPPKKEHTLSSTITQGPRPLLSRFQGSSPPLQQQKAQPRRPTPPANPQNPQPTTTTTTATVKKSNPSPLTVSAPQQRNYSSRAETTTRRPAPPPPPPSPSGSSPAPSSTPTSPLQYPQRSYKPQAESASRKPPSCPPPLNPTNKTQIQGKTKETYKTPQFLQQKAPTRERAPSPSPPPLPPKPSIKTQAAPLPKKQQQQQPQQKQQRQVPQSTVRETYSPQSKLSPSPPPPLPPKPSAKQQAFLPSKPQTAPPRPPGFVSSTIIPGKRQPPPLPPPTPAQKAQQCGSWTKGEVKSTKQQRQPIMISRNAQTPKVQAKGSQNNFIQSSTAKSIRRNEVRRSRRISILVPKAPAQSPQVKTNQNTFARSTTSTTITTNNLNNNNKTNTTPSTTSTTGTTYSVRRSEFRKSKRISVLVPKNSTQNVQVRATQNTSTQSNSTTKSTQQAWRREARRSKRVSVSMSQQKDDSHVPQKPVSIIRNIFPRNNGGPEAGTPSTSSTNAAPVANRWKHAQKPSEPPKDQKFHIFRRSKEVRAEPRQEPRPEPRQLRKSRMYPFTGGENASDNRRKSRMYTSTGAANTRDNRRKSILVHQQQERDERPLPPRPKPLITSKPSFLGASKTTKNMGGENSWKRGSMALHRRSGNDPRKKGEATRQLPNLPLRQPPPSSEVVAKLIVQSVSKSVKESLGKTVTVKSLWNRGDEEDATEIIEEVAKHTITIGEDVFELIDHSPATFHMLRETLALKDDSYLRSFTQDKLDGLRATGKSGSFFYQTKDRKFIIKSINEEEHKCLIDITQDYFMVSTLATFYMFIIYLFTFLARIFGFSIASRQVLQPFHAEEDVWRRVQCVRHHHGEHLPSGPYFRDGVF